MGLPRRKKAHFKSEHEIEDKYECATCGSKDVEGRFWVNLNTGKPDINDWDLNDPGSYWCPNCGKYVEINIIE